MLSSYNVYYEHQLSFAGSITLNIYNLNINQLEYKESNK